MVSLRMYDFIVARPQLIISRPLLMSFLRWFVCVTATKHGKKECPYCKGVPEELIGEAFVRAYNALCTYDGEFIDGFLEHVRAGLQNNDTDRELKNLNRKITRLKERKTSRTLTSN